MAGSIKTVIGTSRHGTWLCLLIETYIALIAEHYSIRTQAVSIQNVAHAAHHNRPWITSSHQHDQSSMTNCDTLKRYEYYRLGSSIITCKEGGRDKLGYRN